MHANKQVNSENWWKLKCYRTLHNYKDMFWPDSKAASQAYFAKNANPEFTVMS